MEVDKVHHRLHIRASGEIAASEDLPERKTYVCSVCGNTIMGEPPQTCPICGATREKFEEAK
jgi:rubrerythrin